MAKLGASDEAFKAAISEVGKTVRSPEQIDLLTVEAAEAKAAEEAAAAVVEERMPGALPLGLPLDLRPDDAEDGVPAPKSKGGRPPGSGNKSTSATRRYILGHIGDPLTMLARRGLEDPVELAARLGCKPIEAFNAQNVALAKCLPYVHSPQPAAVKVEGKGALAIMFTGVEADRAGDEDVEGTDFAALEDMAARIAKDREENQGVTVRDIEPSNVTFTNGGGENEGGSDA